jgi:phosphoglycolate phosphatase
MTATVLVDLDGTITDPARGIIGAYRYALEQMGCIAPPHEELGWVIGPPLRVSFRRVLSAGLDPEVALGHYRTHYAAGGLYDADIYAGIDDALAAIAATGARLLVCTAKPHPYAAPIVRHFGLAHRFHAIYGPELDGTRDDKGDLIAHMLEREGFEPAHAVMIGDRDNDVRAAARHDIPTIGALWGYGGRAELEAAGAARLCERPADLPVLVQELLPSGR